MVTIESDIPNDFFIPYNSETYRQCQMFNRYTSYSTGTNLIDGAFYYAMLCASTHVFICLTMIS